MLKESDKRSIDEMIEAGDGIEKLSYPELGKYLRDLGWPLTSYSLGSIYEYLMPYRDLDGERVDSKELKQPDESNKSKDY